MVFERSDHEMKDAEQKLIFRKLLYAYAEEKILNHKTRLRRKKIDQINYKLFCESKYRDKNAFFEFQIESQMRQLIPSFAPRKGDLDM